MSELGKHLVESAAMVRSWPLEEQRSQAIRGQAPPRHETSKKDAKT